MHDVAIADCPIVPSPRSGTAGQSARGTDIYGTESGTGGGTLSLKALANRVLMRDKTRDISRTSATQAPTNNVPAATSGKTGNGTDQSCKPDALHRPPSWSDPAALPPVASWCNCCHGRRWWCEAAAPRGWRCCVCHPPDHLGADEIRRFLT
jgi:hypothetical protein